MEFVSTLSVSQSFFIKLTYISEGRAVTGNSMITGASLVELSPPKVRSKQGVILRYGDNVLGKIYQNVSFI